MHTQESQSSRFNVVYWLCCCAQEELFNSITAIGCTIRKTQTKVEGTQACVGDGRMFSRIL